jgi:hypothetical protein
MDRDRPGFWEVWEHGGYHMRGDPWAENRFRDDGERMAEGSGGSLLQRPGEGLAGGMFQALWRTTLEVLRGRKVLPEGA